MKTTDHFLHTTTLPSLYLPSSVAYGLNSKAWSESGTFNIFFFFRQSWCHRARSHHQPGFEALTHRVCLRGPRRSRFLGETCVKAEPALRGAGPIDRRRGGSRKPEFRAALQTAQPSSRARAPEGERRWGRWGRWGRGRQRRAGPGGPRPALHAEPLAPRPPADPRGFGGLAFELRPGSVPRPAPRPQHPKTCHGLGEEELRESAEQSLTLASFAPLARRSGVHPWVLAEGAHENDQKRKQARKGASLP